MTTVFEYEHNVPQTVEFVNGSYQLIAIKIRPILGRDILYCLGEASLDNSCCAATDLAYALVIGEVVVLQVRRTADGRSVTLLHAVEDDVLAAEISRTLLATEAVSTVNFYIPPRMPTSTP